MMSLLRNITNGLRSLFRKEQVNRELDEELGEYLEMADDEKILFNDQQSGRARLHYFLGPAKWWSKRLSPQQRQTNDSIHAKFSNLLVRPVYLLTTRADKLLRQPHPAQ
jgi:hypothetical protein